MFEEMQERVGPDAVIAGPAIARVEVALEHRMRRGQVATGVRRVVDDAA
jgi:hypothetical protein